MIDIANGRLALANAGHPSPLIVREATGEVDAINERYPSGPALGLFDDAQFPTHELTVAAGDLFLIFTDGLFKVNNLNSEPYGTIRLRDSIRRHASLALSKLTQDVFTEIETFAQGQDFPDDVCLIGVEVMHLETDLQKRHPQSTSTPAKVAMS